MVSGLLHPKVTLFSSVLSEQNTVFNPDGSITETFSSGDTKTTVFNSDGTITETVKTSGGTVKAVKTTTFNGSTSISEEVTK